jgi:hypothetical protein
MFIKIQLAMVSHLRWEWRSFLRISNNYQLSTILNKIKKNLQKQSKTIESFVLNDFGTKHLTIAFEGIIDYDG